MEVAWDLGQKNSYRVGANDKWDLLLVAPAPDMKVKPIASAPEFTAGSKVVRGRNWKSNDDDGGPGTAGVISEVASDTSVVVRWPNGKSGTYM